MKIYIGYKLSNLPEEEKRSLRSVLESISQILENKGFETFIMGRDVQKWSKEYNPSTKTAIEIFKNMRNYDVLLCFVNSNVKSHGLLFEAIFAKITGKKIYTLVNNNFKGSMVEKLSGKIEYFDFGDNLQMYIDKLFS